MKRFFHALAYLLVAVCAFAAVNQTGYVKTRGRLGSNGQVIPGQRLANATVVLQNNSSVVSNQTGNFNLTLPSNKYYLKDVKKEGYVVSDPDILSKQYAYSANPLVLVLDQPTQQQDDKLASERKLRRNLQKQLQQREDELEALKEENKITQEQYRSALQKLYDDQESNEKFISEMAERYSKMDFDQLDDFQRQFAALIQNGELVRADSLLRTKGSMDDREAELMRLRDANAKERKELSSRQENLSKSEKNEAVMLADFAADCYNHFELCKLKFDNDSAAYWLERRANADTTNGLWLRELGDFLDVNMANYDKSRECFHKALKLAIEQHGEKSEEVSVCLSHLGDIASRTSNYDEALKLYNSAIEIDSLIYGTNSAVVCFNYINKGYIYGEMADNVKAIDNYKRAIKILEDNGNIKQDLLATAYNNLGGVYVYIGQLTEGIELAQKALNIRLRLFYEETSPEIANSYSNLGFLYEKTGNKEKGLEYLLKANEIYHRIYKENHPSIATVYNNLGSILDNDDSEALEYYNKALAIRERIFGEDSPDCARVYNNIGETYFRLGEYEKAIAYFMTALNIYKKYLGDNHPDIATFYYNIAKAYDSLDMVDEALANYLHSAEIYRQNFGEECENLSDCYYLIGDIYLYKNKLSDALDYTNRSTDIRTKLYGVNSRETMKSIAQEGMIYNHWGRYKESYDKLILAYKFFTSKDVSDVDRASKINDYIYMSLTDGIKDNIISYDVLNEYLCNNIITIYTSSGETPAKKQGLEGEYYLLQYNSWDIESSDNIYDLIGSFNGKPKTIILMKEGKISKHNFEDKIGCSFLIKEIAPEDKVRIIEKFHQWNSQNM